MTDDHATRPTGAPVESAPRTGPARPAGADQLDPSVGSTGADQSVGSTGADGAPADRPAPTGATTVGADDAPDGAAGPGAVDDPFGWGPPPWVRRRGGRPWGPPGMMADDEHRGGRGRGRRRGPGGPGGPGGDPGWAAGGGGWGGPGGPGRGGPPPGARWGRGHRRGRGEVRVAVLFLLDEQPMHGYQIIRELTDRTGGRWRPSPGAVYPTLQLLEDEGLVTADEQGGKRVFTLTDDGKAEVARVKEARHAPWTGGDGADGADDPVDQLRTAYLQLGAAARQVADAGTAAQQEAARALLDGARKAIYGILAADD